MGIYVDNWKIRVDLCGSLWIFVDLCGSLWIFVDIASSLIYMLVGLWARKGNGDAGLDRLVECAAEGHLGGAHSC